MRITLVAGLPGSGKSTLLRAFAHQGAVTIDDITDLSLLPAHVVPWLAIADVNFCRSNVRTAAEAIIGARYPSARIEWIFFENVPERCLSNADGRRDGRNVRPDVETLTRLYEIPPGADLLPVIDAGTSPGTPSPKGR